MSYRLIDLFSGAGGMTLGFAKKPFCGDFTPVLAVDFDKSSLETHRENFDGQTVCGDIEEWLLSEPEIPLADAVIGGPPCQGFSLLNRRRTGDQRRALWEPFLDVVWRSDAKIFVMENVAELHRSDELDAIVARAELLGFSVRAGVLNAADYGAPQVRRRTIVVGWKRDLLHAPEFPPARTHASPTTCKALGLRPWRTVRDAIFGLGMPKGFEPTGKPPYNLHFGRQPTEKSLKRYAVIPKGGNRFDLQKEAPELTPACWLKKKSGGTDLFGRLWWDRPSVTIRTEFFKPEKGRYLHPDENRPITHREAARLMGFPDSFVFVGSKTEIARQIGNAVPPDLAGAIGNMVSNFLRANTTVRKHAPVALCSPAHVAYG